MTEQELRRLLAELGGDPDIPLEQHPRYLAAKAARDQAALDLAHTVVAAPFAGVASQKPQLGDYVSAGTPVMSIVADQDVWVEANFKETDLTHVRPGQPATVDGRHLSRPRLARPRSRASAPATGAEFALLPPQNSTGNWVKVVQRIPVRIAIDGRRRRAAAARRHERRSSRSTPAIAASCRASSSPRWPGSGWRPMTAGRAGPLMTPGGAARRHRGMITVSIMLATIMQALDTTIANVALPHMQGSLSATQDQITWVLTSYIVAAAIMTPPTGWLAGALRPQAAVPRRGRRLHRRLDAVRRGAPRSPRWSLFRLLQGVFGAALVPLSQAVLLDIYPARAARLGRWRCGAWASWSARSWARRSAAS